MDPVIVGYKHCVTNQPTNNSVVEIYCSWLQESKLIVNVLTLERIFETLATFRSVEADRNVAHV